MGVKVLNWDESPGAKESPAYNRPIDDAANRVSFNTVFGEKIIGIRKPSIAAQFQYPLQTDSVTVVQDNGATITQANSLLVAQTGTDAAGEASVTSKTSVRYFPGNEAYCMFTAMYTIGVADSTQRAGLFDDNDGFFIGYEDDAFSVGRKRAGTEYIISQNEFNVDKLDGSGESEFTIDPMKINVFMITYGYLGAAPITYSVLKENNTWIPFHIIEYPNSATETHITNAYLPIRGEVKNTGNTTNLTLSSGSIVAGIVDGGGSNATSRSFTFDTGEVTISAGSTCLFIVRSKTLIGTAANKISSIATLVSGAVDLNKVADFKIIKNPTITNTPTWTSTDVASSTETSIDATINIATGKNELSINFEKVGDKLISIKEFDIKINPTDYWGFVITTTGAGDVDFSARWEELF